MRDPDRDVFFSTTVVVPTIFESVRRRDVVRRIGISDMAVRHDGIVLAIGGIQLLHVLDDDEGFHAVSGHVGQGAFQNGQIPQRGKLVHAKAAAGVSA